MSAQVETVPTDAGYRPGDEHRYDYSSVEPKWRVGS